MSAELPVGRVIAHVDLDAFYAQVEIQRDLPRLHNKPVGVIQYNPYGDLATLAPEDDRLMNDSNGSLIAVNYIAREFGVKRSHRGDEARKCCPDIQLVQVPTKHGKADLTIYRQAGRQVLAILGQSTRIKVERASIDECYLDLTEEAQKVLEDCNGIPPVPLNPEQVHIYDAQGEDSNVEIWWNRRIEEWNLGERLLAAGAAVVAALRDRVHRKLGYTCSAGISHTRLLAKLCSGLHKPSQQTVLPSVSTPYLLAPLPLGKLRGLGGEFGQRLQRDLNITTVGQLASCSLNKLSSMYSEKDAIWLYELARGVDNVDVEDRRLPKSVGCGKTFRGHTALPTIESVHYWLSELASELEERLVEDKEENNRTPTLLTVSIGSRDGNGSGSGCASRSCSFRRIDKTVMADDATALVKKWSTSSNEQTFRITDLFLTASSFVPMQSTEITKFFKPQTTTNSNKHFDVCDNNYDDRMAGNAADVSAAVSPKKTTAGDHTDSTAPHRRKVTDTSTGVHPTFDGQTIDESVLVELPLEIQKELRNAMKFESIQAKAHAGRGWHRNSKRSNTSKSDPGQPKLNFFTNKKARKG